jgi:hypothetical protein
MAEPAATVVALPVWALALAGEAVMAAAAVQAETAARVLPEPPEAKVARADWEQAAASQSLAVA